MREAFPQHAAWFDWYGDEVFDDAELQTIDEDGKAVSALISTPYSMTFHGAELGASYLSCVATARAERGRGLMHRLMARALNIAAERGDAFALLVPGSRRLYFLYDTLGFATVFFVDELRYTALHAFVTDPSYRPIEPTYEVFSQLERLSPCRVLHSARQFAQVSADMARDGGFAVAVGNGDGGEAMAMVWTGDEARVVSLQSTGDEATEAVLAEVRARVGEKPIVVLAPPAGRRASLRARAMLRIVNVEIVLSALAAANPEVDQVIRVHDPIVAANNSVFAVRNGECVRVPDTMRRITLDVSVDVLAKILFSSHKIGEIFALPSIRPVLELMLD